MSRTCFLIEDFDPGINYSQGELVSLSPEVSCQLGKRCLNYTTFDEHYSERMLRTGQEAYFFDQLECFVQLDDYLRRQIPYLEKNGLPLAFLFYYRLKSIIDSLVIQSKMVSEFIKNNQCEKIIYVRRESHKGFSLYGRPSFFAELLELMIQQYPNKSLNFRVFSTPNTLNVSRGRLKHKLLDSAKKLLRPLKFKALRNFFRYEKFRFLLNTKRPWKDLNLLFLHAGSDRIDPAIKYFLHGGANVYVKARKEIICLSSLIDRKVLELEVLDECEENREIRLTCERAFEGIEKAGVLYPWVNQKCSAEVTHLLKPYIEYFLKELAPTVIKEATLLQQFYQDKRIHYVIAQAITDFDPLSGIAAAHITAGVKTVCFEHGTQLLRTETSSIQDLHFFDFYFTGSDVTKRMLQHFNSVPFIKPARVLTNPYRYASLKQSSNKSHAIKGGRQRVLFVPSKLSSLHKRSMNNMIYPITWYFEFQKVLMDYFASKERFEFIYKMIDSAQWMYESVVPYLAEKKYKNILTTDDAYVDCLQDVDKILLDRPTTGFFEAAATGLPVLCVCHDTLRLFEEVLGEFGKSIQTFSGFDDAIRIIDCFLEADSEQYVVRLSVNGQNPFHELYLKRDEVPPRPRTLIDRRVIHRPSLAT